MEKGFVRPAEQDIPGASLGGRKPSQLNVKQVRRWLASRGAGVGGTKAELIDR